MTVAVVVTVVVPPSWVCNGPQTVIVETVVGGPVSGGVLEPVLEG